VGFWPPDGITRRIYLEGTGSVWAESNESDVGIGYVSAVVRPPDRVRPLRRVDMPELCWLVELELWEVLFRRDLSGRRVSSRRHTATTAVSAAMTARIRTKYKAKAARIPPARGPCDESGMIGGGARGVDGTRWMCLFSRVRNKAARRRRVITR